MMAGVNSSSGKSGRLRLEILTGLAVVTLLAAVGVVAYRTLQQRVRVEGDSLPVRLAAVRPDASDALLDARGRKIGESIFDQNAAPPWGPAMFRRDFLFELATTDEPMFIPTFQLTDARRRSSQTVGLLTVYRGPDGGYRLEADAVFPSERREKWLWFFSRLRRVKQVDLRIAYYLQKPGKVALRFEGPFAAEEKRIVRGTEELTAESDADLPPGGAAFHITTTYPYNPTCLPVVAVDRSGRRHMVRAFSLANRGGGFEARFWVPGVSLEEIASICLEPPREKVFRNVRVYYPERPATGGPAFYPQLLAALANGTSQGDLAHYRFRDADEALRVISVVRGEFIGRAWRALREGEKGIDLTKMPEAQGARLRAVAKRWTAAWNPSVRAAGIGLGMAGGWAEFVEPAIELLRSANIGARSEAVNALTAVAGSLTGEQVEQIGRIVAEDEGRFPRELIERLARQPGAAPEMMLNRLAEADQAWIWWRAIQSLSLAEWQQRDVSEKIRARLAIVYAEPHFVDQTVPRRSRLAAGLLTRELSRRDAALFYEIHQRVAEGDREVATAAFVQFLKGTPSPGLERFVAVRMVREINRWHGRDFGKMGHEISAPLPDLDARGWERTAEELAQWQQARRGSGGN